MSEVGTTCAAVVIINGAALAHGHYTSQFQITLGCIVIPNVPRVRYKQACFASAIPP